MKDGLSFESSIWEHVGGVFAGLCPQTAIHPGVMPTPPPPPGTCFNFHSGKGGGLSPGPPPPVPRLPQGRWWDRALRDKADALLAHKVGRWTASEQRDEALGQYAQTLHAQFTDALTRLSVLQHLATSDVLSSLPAWSHAKKGQLTHILAGHKTLQTAVRLDVDNLKACREKAAQDNAAKIATFSRDTAPSDELLDTLQADIAKFEALLEQKRAAYFSGKKVPWCRLFRAWPPWDEGWSQSMPMPGRKMGIPWRAAAGGGGGGQNGPNLEWQNLAQQVRPIVSCVL